MYTFRNVSTDWRILTALVPPRQAFYDSQEEKYDYQNNDNDFVTWGQETPRSTI